MPIFRFTGFQTGTPVDLSATQNTSSDTGSVSTWAEGATTPITLSLGASRISGTAPFGAVFTATANSPAARVVLPYHDIESVWSFDDPGQFTSLDNNPLWGADKNIAYGPRATHVFAGANTYMVTCTSHDGENPAKSENITIEVADPNDVFAGADTAVVSVNSDFAGKPLNAAEFTTVSSALSHLSGRTNARLLLRAGETFSGGISITENGGGGRKLQIGRFGSGDRPILDCANGDTGIDINTASSNYDEIAVFGLRVIGNFDPTVNSWPNAPRGSGIDLDGVGRATHKTIVDCRFENCGNYGIRCSGGSGSPQINLYIADTRVDGWNNYGMHCGDAGVVGLSGVSLKQPTGTRNGNGKFVSPYYADHGPTRFSRPDGVFVLSNCDFCSMNSWSHDAGRTYQPCLRWNSGFAGSDQEIVLDRYRFEGGPFRLYNETATPSIKTPVWAVADRVFGICSDHPGTALQVELGGTTVRNTVVVLPNSAPGWGTGTRTMFGDNGGGNTAAGWNTRRAEVYSSAIVDLRTDDQASSRGDFEAGNSDDRDFDVPGFTQISPNFFGNNILHAPNMNTGGETGDAPLNEAGRWTPQTDGERWENEAVDTSRAPGTSATASFEPLTGSTAIGGATGKVSILDMSGDLRSDVLDGLSRGAASEGPYEPNLEF